MMKYESFADRLERIMEDNYQDESFGVLELCEKLHLSRSQTHNKIKKIKSVSTSIFIRNYRLGKAKSILEEYEEINVSEVAYEVGFSAPSYFSRLFKKKFGSSPVHFKKIMQMQKSLFTLLFLVCSLLIFAQNDTTYILPFNDTLDIQVTERYNEEGWMTSKSISYLDTAKVNQISFNAAKYADEAYYENIEDLEALQSKINDMNKRRRDLKKTYEEKSKKDFGDKLSEDRFFDFNGHWKINIGGEVTKIIMSQLNGTDEDGKKQIRLQFKDSRTIIISGKLIDGRVEIFEKESGIYLGDMNGVTLRFARYTPPRE